jgi:hypothetical protein
MKLKGPTLVLAASILAGALSLVGTAHATTVLFSGNTSASTPTTIDTYLVYTFATFTDVSVPVGPGSTTLPNLGTFTLNACSGNNCTEPFGTSVFTLRITFTDPTVSGSPELLAADIYGTIYRSGNSNNIGNGSSLTIDFDNNVQHLTYTNADGSGAFDLSVNDPAPYTAASSFGDTRTVTGQIENLTFEPSDPPPNGTVPEPSTLILVGIGLIAVSAVTRSQLQKR